VKKPRDFEPSELVVLRTPLLPVEEIEAWSSGLLSPGADGAGLPEALAHDRALLRERLKAAIERPEVREALFLASPDLVESLAQWQRDPESKKGQRTEQGLVRYFLRMASRPTPFGLFSGCTAGTVGESTRLDLAERGSYRRHSRLDMDYLFALCEHLGKDPGLRSEILFRPNTSLYETAGRFRYAEARVAGRLRSYHLVAVDVFDALKSTIERAADGARLQELAEALVAEDPDGDITLEDAAEFLNDLVDNQILVPDLELPVTGEESTPALLRQLAGVGSAAKARERLARAEQELAGIDADGLGGSDSERYRGIARELEPLGVPVELSRLVQVDMTKPAQEIGLGQDLIDEVLRGIGVLHRVAPALSDGPLEDFRQAFRDRYGEGNEVPLLAALDEESGIGFGKSSRAAAEASPLLEGLPFNPPVDRMQVAWSLRDVALLRLLNKALIQGRTEVSLTEEDVTRLADPEQRPLPAAFHTLVALAAGSPEALEQGDWRMVVDHAVGPSGARLLGRFCHADDRIHQGVRDHLAAEEALNPDAVFAEIVHLPGGRVGNVLARPVLRSHEIVFLGSSGAPRERQIRVDDLMVTVAGDRVRLRSKSLGREVIPRLSTAHNPHRGGLGVYRLLAALQGQGLANGVMWSWGQLESSPFLPRVSFGRVVLSRARWQVEQAEVKPVVKASGANRYRLARQWQQERRMPRLVFLVDGDNELLLDFDNPLSLDAVVELVKNRNEFTLMEIFPSPDELCVRGPEGRFFHEILLSFARRPAEPSQPVDRAPRALPVTPAPIRRTFPPGSEWLYAKVYTGTATLDQVLRDEIAPLAREAVAAGEARSWFFIRYGDPEWHLRLRFRGEPDLLRGALLPRLEESFQRLLQAGAAWKLQIDTYEREVERYGGDEGIELSEELFFHDSVAVAAMLDSLASGGGDSGADLRWRLMVLGVDRMMTDFGYDLEGRQRLAERCRTGFAGRYRQDALRAPMADRLRRERPALERLLARSEGSEELQPSLDALAQRSRDSAGIVRELRARERQGRLRTTLDEVLPSYLHMFVNRLSRSAGPEHELVIYDFLSQIYSSVRARARARERAAAPVSA